MDQEFNKNPPTLTRIIHIQGFRQKYCTKYRLAGMSGPKIRTGTDWSEKSEPRTGADQRSGHSCRLVYR